MSTRQTCKQIEGAGYWRFIYVAEGGGPNLFWVFQEDVLTPREVDGKLKDVEFVSPGAVACKYDSKEAAMKRVEEYLNIWSRLNLTGGYYLRNRQSAEIVNLVAPQVRQFDPAKRGQPASP